MDTIVLDFYTDYLISSFGQVTATGLSTLLGGHISHDRISRFLAAAPATSADLWRWVKPLVRQVQSSAGVLVIDDSVEAKPSSDESELICWHWDHVSGRSVKGVNLLTALYYTQDVSLPVAFELVRKPDIVADKKTGRPKRQARVSKNARYQQMVRACVDNALPFGYVLNDTWFASADNMVFVKSEGKREFVMPLKDNRHITFDAPQHPNRTYADVSSLELEANSACTIWLAGVDFALLLAKQVFTNEDGSQGVVYRVTSDTTLAWQQITTLYQKRWKVEEYHKSLKSNLAFARSPTKTIRTQTNHIFASLLAFVKMEQLRLHTKCNHFAMKAQLYKAAIAAAYQPLQHLKTKCSLA